MSTEHALYYLKKEYGIKDSLIYYCDNYRHLVCYPYSISNLHEMAKDLNIKKCWFHKDHYDIPKKRIEEIRKKCFLVDSQTILNTINGNLSNQIDY